jgi:hypothetical protein
MVCGLALLCASISFAESIDTLVEKAVTNLVAVRTTAITVRIETINLRNSVTVSEFAEHLRDQVNLYAGKNWKYKVIIPPPETPPATRGALSVRPNNIDQGRISGTYYLLGDEVEVILSLILDANNQQIAVDKFRIPVTEIERLGLEILPPNRKTQEEALELEKLLADPAAQVPASQVTALEPQTPEPPLVQPPAVTASPIASAVQPAALVPASQATPAGTVVQPPVAPQPEPVLQKAGFTLNVWPDHDSRVYYDGEQMTVRLWADHDCYFIVYHIDVNNVRQVLFPNQYDKGTNFLKANEVKTIPVEGSQFDICEPFGEEWIEVFASEENFTISDAEHIVQPVSRGLMETSRSMVRGIRPSPSASATPVAFIAPLPLSAETMFSVTILAKK